MNRLRDMDTGFGVHVYRKPDLALVLGETGQRLPDVYLEVQHPCWSCNSNSSSANASAGVR